MTEVRLHSERVSSVWATQFENLWAFSHLVHCSSTNPQTFPVLVTLVRDRY